MEKIVPKEIVNILKKFEGKMRGEPVLNDIEKEKLHTFLCSLESAIINPVNKKGALVNPIPNKPDISIKKEETMIDRIRHINSVSARVRSMDGRNEEDEINDFLEQDLDELEPHPVPKSIFTVADHEVELEPEVLSPSEEKIGPGDESKSEAAPLPTEVNQEER